MQWIKLMDAHLQKEIGSDVTTVCPLGRRFILRDRSSERRSRGGFFRVHKEVNKIKILLTRVEAETASALDLPGLGRIPAVPAAAAL